jgi:Ca2+-binding RTX toxin-like protein
MDGNDTIRGGRGRDVLVGGNGIDNMHGGKGSDWIADPDFIYRAF